MSSANKKICCFDFRGVELSCVTGNIVLCELEGICISCDSNYRLLTGLGAAVKRAGGHEFERRLNLTTLHGGIISVLTNNCGTLSSLNVIIAPLRRSSRLKMNHVYSEILEKAVELNLKTLALPVLGTGAFGLSFNQAAHNLKIALKSCKSFGVLKKIQFMDLNFSSMNVFANAIQNINSFSNTTNTFLQNLPSLLSTQSQLTLNNEFLSVELNESALELKPANLHLSAESLNLSVNTDFQNMFAQGSDVLKCGKFWSLISTAEMKLLREENIQSNYKGKKNLADGNKSKVNLSESDDEVLICSICLNEMLPKFEKDLKLTPDQLVVRLDICKHLFHQSCIEAAFQVKHQCPLCMVWYAPAEGNQPEGSTMKVRKISGFIACNPDAKGLYEINYNVPGGIQADSHLRPGHRYCSTNRTAYLPNNTEGTIVLKLLDIAFKRRLIFTVGDSVTSGKKNVVVWNGIHHKTKIHGGPYGYPDPGYLSRVQEELASFGISKNLLPNSVTGAGFSTNI